MIASRGHLITLLSCLPSHNFLCKLRIKVWFFFLLTFPIWNTFPFIFTHEQHDNRCPVTVVSHFLSYWGKSSQPLSGIFITLSFLYFIPLGVLFVLSFTTCHRSILYLQKRLMDGQQYELWHRYKALAAVLPWDSPRVWLAHLKC